MRAQLLIGCLLALAVAAATLAASTHSASFPASAQPDRRGRPGDGQMNVDVAMKLLNRSYRQLRSQIDDAARLEENLRLIGEMQRACLACKSQPVPPTILREIRDDAEREKIPGAYRRHLIVTMRTLLDLEEDVVDGKVESARARLSELIRQRDAGHAAIGMDAEEEPTELPAPTPPAPAESPAR